MERPSTTRREHRDQIEALARDAFKDHVLLTRGTASVDRATPGNPAQSIPELRPYVWRCHSSNAEQTFYWFYVAELPGAIVQYGDVGGLLIEQGPSYDLAWLDGAINSMDYVLSKSKARREFFVQEKFDTYLREHDLDPREFRGYADYVANTGDSDSFDSCHDWSTDVLWAYWALRRFVELRRA